MTIRRYTLELDRGPKPWETGYSREFRFEPVASTEASSKIIATRRLLKENMPAVEDAAAARIVCDGRI